MDTERELIDETELARRTGTSTRTWQAYRVRKYGPPYIRISARCIRYDWRKVVIWLEDNQVVIETRTVRNMKE